MQAKISNTPEVASALRGRTVEIEKKGEHSSYVVVQGEPVLKVMRWLVTNDVLEVLK